MQAPRFVFAMIVAILIAGGCTIWLSQKLSANRTAPAAQTHYLAASHALNAGEALKAEDVRLEPWPASAPLQGALNEPRQVVGRALLYALPAGQPIVEKHLAPVGTGAGLTSRIPRGMRAVAVRTDEVAGVAGFLLPGTHVDLLVTYRPSGRTDAVTTTVLQDVQVLAAGHQFEPDASGKPVNVSVVTLLLDPRAAEQAVVASAQGTVQFLLRNDADHEQADVRMAAFPPLEVAHGASVHAAPRSASRMEEHWLVETLAGSKLSTDSFK